MFGNPPRAREAEPSDGPDSGRALAPAISVFGDFVFAKSTAASAAAGAAALAATSELGGRLANRPIATARPWPSDVLALSFRAPADRPIAVALNLHQKKGIHNHVW